MSNPLTPFINNNNVNNIRKQIHLNNDTSPFLATLKDSYGVLTDHDVFPYTRYFQGVPEYTSPIVAEREAGFRPVNNHCYNLSIPNEFDPENKANYPDHCFQAPCSTVYPCYPELADFYKNRKELDLILNKNCVIQYR